MPLKELDKTIFYSMDKSIKSYRQFAAKNLRDKMGTSDITIDQWLVLKTVKDNPDMSQKEIAEKVFKDYASITRIIEILVQKDYLIRMFNHEDRRRFKLRLTALGELTYESLVPIISQNRKTALAGISKSEIKIVQNILNKIIHNCQVTASLAAHS
jgi:DNA-binding MarR family transcriptional regulator